MNYPIKPGCATEPTDPTRCVYCGAALLPQYYFCALCATPYKPPESVLPRRRPRQLTDSLLVSAKAPMAAPLVWTYLLVVAGGGILSAALFGHRPEAALLFQAILLTGTTAVFGALYWPSLVVQLRAPGFTTLWAYAGLAMLLPLLGINWLYHGWLIQHAPVPPNPIAPLQAAGMGLGSVVLLFCAMPAIVEELAFRGLLQHWLQVAIQPGRALLLASALFAGMHFSLVSFPYLFAVGLLLGWTKLKTRSLYPSMTIHFLHNLGVIMFFW